VTIYSVTPGTPGEWAALAADRLLLVVRADAALEPAALLGELAGTEPARRVIEALTSRGLAATPSFALLEHPDGEGPVRVIVRGEITVSGSAQGQPVEIGGSGVATWVERLVDGFEEAVVTTSAVSSGTALPLGHGAVWASRVSVSSTASSPIAAGTAPVAAGGAGAVDDDSASVAAASGGVAADVIPVAVAPLVAAAPPVAEIDLADAAGVVDDAAASDAVADDADAADAAEPAGSTEEPADAEATEPEATEPDAEAAAEPEPADLPAEPEPLVEQTIIPSSDDALAEESAVDPAAPAEEPAAPESDADAEGSDYDHLFEATIVRPIEDAAVRPPEEGEEEAAEAAAAPAAPAAPAFDPSFEGEHDGQTVLSFGTPGHERPAESEIPAAPAGPQFWLVLPSGIREQLTRETLVGRAPAGRVTGGELPRLVTLAGDPDISRTHVRFQIEGDTVVVTDLNSRNGTSVVLPGKPPQLLRGDEPVAVIAGTLIDLGGGSVITLEQSA
jgi:hypothetical protein